MISALPEFSLTAPAAAAVKNAPMFAYETLPRPEKAALCKQRSCLSKHLITQMFGDIASEHL